HEMLYTLLPELKRSEVGAVNSEKLPELRGVITLSEQPAEGMLSWVDLLGRAELIDRQQLIECGRQLQFDDPINIQYTSGTTGPKGATLSHYSILNNAYMVCESMRLTEHDRLVIPVPLYHCFGMVMGNLGCVTHGSTMIYPSASFEPLATLQAAAEEKA
ncbi:AMP-binding protein, partial [Pseudomonas aeruginosa]|uniref:AMP-binding protein n=1 Tax=Pseudomonas aeruginosa TaxID=287 RepID=UPI002713C4F7